VLPVARRWNRRRQLPETTTVSPVAGATAGTQATAAMGATNNEPATSQDTSTRPCTHAHSCDHRWRFDRHRARCEDRIRCAKDTGLRNLPLHGYGQNQIWCEIVALARELIAWMQMLSLTGTARRWEPKRLRLRLYTAAARMLRGSRRLRLRIAGHWPWAQEITAAITHLQTLAPG
jgi:Transposase DDE domain group 1